jgi:hypothetical protein
MTLNEMFDIVESNELSARINVASGFASALAIARTQPAVRELAKEIGSNQALGETVLRRVLDVVGRASDIRYEHRYDTALMIYTLLLSEWSEAFGSAAAALVSHVPNLWWASTLAAKILEQSERYGPAMPMSEDSQDGTALGFNSGDLLFVSDVRGVLSIGRVTSAETSNILEGVAAFVETKLGRASSPE